MGMVLILVGIGCFFIPVEFQFIGWVLILIGSMVLYLAGYFGFNNLIAKISKKTQN